MMDETRLAIDQSRGMRAQQLLENDMLDEAFKGLEEAYTAAWRATTIDDVMGREKLFLAINVVGKVRSSLHSIVSNGKLAAKELQQIAEAGERKKYGTLQK